MTGPPVLELRDATIGYGDRPVVHGVDLSVARGEVVALLGPNGSGKTTLVRGVLGLADRMGGTIEVHGRPLDRLAERWRVGYVPQRHSVAGAVPSTVRELVASGRLTRLGLLGRLRPPDRAAVAAAIEAVDLTERAGTDVAQLSGGQQRRVLIARALAGEPDLLVMDEPTAGVDRASQHALVRTLVRQKERGVTLVVVTHEVGPLVPIVDRVVVLDQGRIVLDGPWDPALLGAADGGELGVDHHHHLDDQLGDHPEARRQTSWASAVEAPVRER